MRSNILTICGLLSLILFGYGIGAFTTQKMKLNKELEITEQAAKEGYPLESKEKKFRESMFLSKVAMIAGLGGLFLTFSRLDKRPREQKRKRVFANRVTNKTKNFL